MASSERGSSEQHRSSRTDTPLLRVPSKSSAHWTHLPDRALYGGHATLCRSDCSTLGARGTERNFVQWSGQSPIEATWETLTSILTRFPSLGLEDMASPEGVDNDMDLDLPNYRGEG
ncbi:hypothetical protein Salat_0084300 [Sesamum alatum]|uniref:Uncharacterized protein n=1 Tax=Sesamum alatum TaxID=300844 RepID=A0AAE1YW41_9LAMI|nr:hypothetical protein Salat_0084300 [Sesamum alatum]